MLDDASPKSKNFSNAIYFKQKVAASEENVRPSCLSLPLAASTASKPPSARRTRVSLPGGYLTPVITAPVGIHCESVFCESSSQLWYTRRSSKLLSNNFQMIDSRLSAQRRPMRNLPADTRDLQKTSTYIVPCFLLVELVIMAGTVLLAYYFEYTDTFPVHIQGFFCFDKSYSKPYPGPEDNSKAPPVLVYSLVTAIPTVTILIGEVTSFFVKTEGAQEKTIVTADCCYFNPLLRRIVRFLGVYSFGLFTTTIFANAGQVVTGNQTPHFLSACRPNYTALGCQSPLQYITERRACTGHPYLVASARKSFPSKDAALSFYSAVYTVMYVTLVFQTKGTRLTKPTLCLVLLSLAVLVGVVRVTEHRNHWNDIVAGFVTGGAIAAFLVSCVINNFRPTQIAVPNPPPPQRAEPTIGLPLISLPRVESPLEKLQGYRILRSHDHQPIPSPTPPDVLLPSRRCLTSAV